MIPESVIKAVASAPHSEIRNTLLASWGLSPNLKTIPKDEQVQAIKNLALFIDPPHQNEIPI